MFGLRVMEVMKSEVQKMIKYETSSSPSKEPPTDHTNGATVRFGAFTRWQDSCEREMVRRWKVSDETVEEGTMLGCLLCLMNAKTSGPELHVRSFSSFVSMIMYTTLRPSLSRNDTQ